MTILLHVSWLRAFATAVGVATEAEALVGGIEKPMTGVSVTEAGNKMCLQELVQVAPGVEVAPAPEVQQLLGAPQQSPETRFLLARLTAARRTRVVLGELKPEPSLSPGRPSVGPAAALAPQAVAGQSQDPLLN